MRASGGNPLVAPPRTAQAVADRILNLTPSPTMAMDAKAKAMVRSGIDVINLSVGEPDFDTPDHIKEAAIAAIQEGFNKYTPAGGIPELKEAIAEKLSRENGVDYSPNEVVACVGGKQAVCNVFLAICDPGDEVIVHAPTWPTFLEQIKLAQGNPVTVPLASPFSITADPLVERITPKTRAILLNSPCNPTGEVADPAEIRKLAQACVERGIYFIADETYEHFLYGATEHLSPASMGADEKANVITVNTVSKTYAMTGWRLGYVAGPEPVIKAINDLMTQITSNPTSAAQKAAIAALTGPQDCVQEMVAEFSARRTLLVEGLRDLGYTCALPGGAFYAFPQVKGDEQDMAVADRLLEEAHVATVPGSSFLADGYLRMSYATSREKLQEALERLQELA